MYGSSDSVLYLFILKIFYSCNNRNLTIAFIYFKSVLACESCRMLWNKEIHALKKQLSNCLKRTEWSSSAGPSLSGSLDISSNFISPYRTPQFSFCKEFSFETNSFLSFKIGVHIFYDLSKKKLISFVVSFWSIHSKVSYVS